MKTKDTEVLGRELNQARPKPDTVDRPVTTAHIFVHHYNSTQYCKRARDSFLYIPLPPDQVDQHHISDVAKWRYITRCCSNIPVFLIISVEVYVKFSFSHLNISLGVETCVV